MLDPAGRGLAGRTDGDRERRHDGSAAGGLLADVVKRVLELEVEMAGHLGYDKHDPTRRDGGNGTRAKTVLTDVGPVALFPQRV